MEALIRLELMTAGLQNQCSTAELQGLIKIVFKIFKIFELMLYNFNGTNENLRVEK